MGGVKQTEKMKHIFRMLFIRLFSGYIYFSDFHLSAVLNFYYYNFFPLNCKILCLTQRHPPTEVCKRVGMNYPHICSNILVFLMPEFG